MGKGTGFFTGYPKRVILILANEFCERFSYYGMKVILVLYLTRALGYSSNTAVSIYHAFSAVTYFTPLFGAMIADGWLGKYKTILYVSMIYGLGNIAMSVTAIKFNGEYITWGVFIGLVLIAIGAGGIKPCVSAFGGDQFKPEQVKQKNSFFSLFYMFINIGSLLTTLITPYIRSNVFCFNDNCYSLAFGIPAILMVISIICFAIGSPFYTKNPPGESILSKIFGCVWTALRGKLKCGKSEEEKKEHWLDYAETKYDKQLIDDVKDVMGVLWLFLPLPFFWAVYDQQGSRWTLQATQMNGDFGSFVMQPDMMGIMNSLMVVVMAPLLESLIFPCLDHLRIPNTPLQRMSLGMILGATAFLMSGLLQIGIDNSVPAKPAAGETKAIFINTAPCNAMVQFGAESANIASLTSTDYYFVQSGNQTFEVMWDSKCPPDFKNESVSYVMDSKKAYQVMLIGNVTNVNSTILKEQNYLDRTPDSASTFRFFNTLSYPVTVRLHPTKSQDDDKYLYNISRYDFSDYVVLVFADFDVFVTNEDLEVKVPTRINPRLKSKNGAIYNVILNDPSNSPSNTSNVTYAQLTDMGPWTMNIFLQVPQYVVLTLAECLFSITGLGFAYTQAPMSMKSLLTAAWLLTVAVGNLIIIIIDESTGNSDDQSIIFFIFAGVLYVVTILFAIMSFFYKYVEPRTADADGDRKSSLSSSNSSNSDGPAGDVKVAVFGVTDESNEKPPLPASSTEAAPENGSARAETEDKQKELVSSLEQKLDDGGHVNEAVDDKDSDSVKF